MKNTLETDFNAIAAMKNPQRRGIAFQHFLRALLAQTGFEVHENPKVARPRQSDLFAIRDNFDCLIEAKWLSRKIDSSDIDDLMARLNRTPTPDWLHHKHSVTGDHMIGTRPNKMAHTVIT